MYEHETFEVIKQRILDRVSDELDKRESSFLYNATAPIAVEHQNMYIALDTILDLTFFDTSDRGGKLERCRERGINLEQFNATYSIVTAHTEPEEVDVPIGSRFNYDKVNFVVTSKISDGYYKMQCETLGEEGNVTGELTPIDYIRNLTYAEITSIDTYGEDEAGIDVIDKAYYDSLHSNAFGGNRADYMQKLHQVAGVGGVKCYSAAEWMGGGTCKLVIQTSSFTVPSASFVNELQTMVDPLVNRGAGYGIAPIGHTVTVAGCTSTTINISFELTLYPDYIWDDVKPYILETIEDYFHTLNKEWENVSQIVVRISHLETRILEIAGVLDIQHTKLNGEEGNLYLDPDSIAVRGDITNVERT